MVAGRTGVIALIGCLAFPNTSRTQSAPRFHWPRDTVLIDDRIPIVVSGLTPSGLVTIHARSNALSSTATFLVDRTGEVDLSRTMPLAGSYTVADAMGLFWSAAPDSSAPPPPPAQATPRLNAPVPPPAAWVLTARVDGKVVATDTVWRRVVRGDVRITRIREDSVVGVLYEPAGGGRHPAIVVLAGSSGGTAPAAGPPGGLASNGYVVLSLPFFNDEGVPAQLSRIPLEYFERALLWLGARPNVDPRRIGIYGTSRGGELALLLGATYPRLIRAVAAFVPSSVMWNGCCDSLAAASPSWTLRGAPLPYMAIQPEVRTRLEEVSLAMPLRQTPQFLDRLADTAAAARAAIPVEKSGGAILLVSGKDDRLWPSYVMAEQVMTRLRRHRYPHEFRHLAFDEAGHLIVRPYTSTMNLNDNVHPVSHLRNDFGGTPPAQARAREESWRAMLAFFDRHLRGDASKSK